MSRRHLPSALERLGLRRSVLGLAMVARFAVVPVVAQSPASGGTGALPPPPHFAAADAPGGALVDVSQTPALQERFAIDLHDVPLDSALLVVLRRTHIYLAYRGDVIPPGRTVSLTAPDITVGNALAVLLSGTGLDVLMNAGGTFALAPCPHLVAQSTVASATMTGRVVDRATGQPLADAVVSVVGTFLTTTVSATGQYRFAGMPEGSQVIEARMVGYAPERVTVIVNAGQVVQDFALTAAARPLEDVVVTGSLVPTAVKALPTPITVISADDIRRQHVMRLDQLFRGQVPSALAWDRTTNDYFTSINARGTTSFVPGLTSVKTFVDGIEVANPQFVALLDPASIERIELTRGPQASTMYGSNALGGVLQVFTKKGEFSLARPGGEVAATASLIEKNDGPGVAAREEVSVTLRGGEAQTRYHVAGYYRHDGEWTPSYQNTNWSVTASGENVQGPLTSRITAIFARKVFDRPWYTVLRDLGYIRFSRPPHETIDLQTQTFGTNFVYTPLPWWRHELVLGYDRWAFGFVQTQPRLTTPADTLLQVIINHRGKLSLFYFATARATLGRKFDATLTAGFNYDRIDGADAFSPATTVNAGTLTGPTTIVRAFSSNSGYFAQTQIALAEAAFLTAGLRAEQSPGFGEHVGMVVSPRTGIAYVRLLGPLTVKARASYGESIRAPDPAQNQSFSSAAAEQYSNPDLRPERQRGSDGGVDFSWDSRFSLSATYYNQEAVDLIDGVVLGTVGDPPRSQSQQQNVGRIKNRGWEVEAQYHFARWQISGAFSTSSSRIQQLDILYRGAYQIGDQAFEVPRHLAGLTVAYHPFAGTMLRGSITNTGSWMQRDLVALYGALYGGVPSRPSDRDYWVIYPGFTKFRIGLDQRLWKNVSSTFDVENVTNQRVFEPENLHVPSPRVFVVGIRTSY